MLVSPVIGHNSFWAIELTISRVEISIIGHNSFWGNGTHDFKGRNLGFFISAPKLHNGRPRQFMVLFQIFFSQNKFHKYLGTTTFPDFRRYRCSLKYWILTHFRKHVADSTVRRRVPQKNCYNSKCLAAAAVREFELAMPLLSPAGNRDITLDFSLGSHLLRRPRLRGNRLGTKARHGLLLLSFHLVQPTRPLKISAPKPIAMKKETREGICR